MKLQDLKRGMRCTLRNGTNKIIDTVCIEPNRVECLPNKQGVKATYFSFNEYLYHKDTSDLDIVKVEDITLDGYEVIWERKEEKFYLKLPRGYSNSLVLNYGCLSERFYFDSRDEGSHRKTQFTKEEIEELPNQDFIQSLEKEPVK